MSKDDIVKTLSVSPMFQGFSPADLERLAALGSECEFTAGEMLFERGEDGPDFFYLVLEGTVDVMTSKGERQASRSAGEVVGEIGPVSQSGRRVRTVIARHRTRVARWHLQAIEGEAPDLVEPLTKAMKDLAWSRANPFIRNLSS